MNMMLHILHMEILDFINVIWVLKKLVVKLTHIDLGGMLFSYCL